MNYIDILKSVEYPETTLILDFESFFSTDYSLKNLSNIEYINNEQFEITGFGYQLLNTPVGDLSPKFVFAPNVKTEIKNFQDKFGFNLENITLVGQNLMFDALILKEKFNIFCPFMIDIIFLARHQDARMKHDLASLAKHYRTTLQKKDNQQFKGFHFKDIDQNALESYGLTDICIESELFQILLPKLTNPQIELPIMQHTLRNYLLPVFKLDFGLARELIGKMQHELKTTIEKTEATQEQISGNISFIELLNHNLPENEKIPMKMGKNKMIAALAKNDIGMTYLLQHKDEKIRNLAVARLAVRSWPLHIKRVQNLINQTKVRNGYLGCPLWYYGGHTGRWSGTQGINMQNFGGTGRGESIHPLIGRVKNCLVLE